MIFEIWNTKLNKVFNYYLFRVVLCTLLTILVSQNINSQTTENKKLERVIKNIKKQKHLFTNYVLDKKSVKIANKLNEIASEQDLIKLSNANCRLCYVYSFWILSKRKSELTKKMYSDYHKRTDPNFIEVNRFKNNTSCLKIIYCDDSFINEIYKERKHLNKIKTAYNKV